jgi:beta-glucosidase
MWDDFAAVPGRIKDGTTADPACDHVHRLDADLDLLSWLGVDAYRFSISWPRVQPGGSGPLSSTGMDFYSRLIDGLLARGIHPVATLYHWDLPSELNDAGGWLTRDTADRFGDYAGFMAQAFGDRVQRWATLNEPWVSAYLGYAAGIHAPGVTDPASSVAAAYYLMLGHGRALAQLRSHTADNCGIVLNLIPAIAQDTRASTMAATEHIDSLHNRFCLDLLAGRGVSPQLRSACASFTDFAFLRDDDLTAISATIDWIGENYYTITRVSGVDSDVDLDAHDRAALAAYPATPAARMVPHEPITDMGWEIYPQGLTDVLHLIDQSLPGIPIWVTENGAAAPDPQRLAYLRDHLHAVLNAHDEGVDVRGYFAWSLLDNIEWAEGMTKQFGIVAVDPQTQQRSPKASARWYRKVIADRSLINP